MKYVFQFCRILLFCFLGELLHHFLPLPIPASIYGLMLLFTALLTGIVRLDQIQEISHYLIAIFPLLFVPAATGVMELWTEISGMLIPALLAIFLVTAIVMVAAGKVTQLFLKKEDSSHDSSL